MDNRAFIGDMMMMFHDMFAFGFVNDGITGKSVKVIPENLVIEISFANKTDVERFGVFSFRSARPFAFASKIMDFVEVREI